MDSSRPEVGSVAVVESEGRAPSAEERKQTAKFQKVFALLWSSPSARPVIVAGALGSPLLLSKLPEGFLWGPIEVPGISLVLLGVLASFAARLVFEGAVWLAGIFAPFPRYCLSVLEVWLLYRMGCIPPAVYFEHVAKLHAARLKGHLAGTAHATERDTYALRTLRWRMDSGVRRTVSQNPTRKRQNPKPKGT